MHNDRMTALLVSAATRRTVAPAGTIRRPLATRAAAQHAGHRSAVLDRVTTTAANVPSASAFQSAL